VFGSIVCELTHIGIVADAGNYLLHVTLSVTGSGTADVQQEVLEFSDVANPYQAGDGRL
jgi:hypothetical protein